MLCRLLLCAPVLFVAYASACNQNGCGEITLENARSAFEAWRSTDFNCNGDELTRIDDAVCIVNQLPKGIEPPVFDPLDTQTVAENQQLDFSVNATDVDSASLTYSAGRIPANSSFSAATRTFDFSPDFTQAGRYDISFKVDDGYFLVKTIVTVIVTNDNQPPVLGAIGNQQVAPGQALQLQLSATNPDGDPLTFAVTPLPLPANASLNAQTGTFTFAPGIDQTGSYDLTFSVGDGSASDSETVTIEVPVPTPGVTRFQGQLSDTNAAVRGSAIPIVGATVSFLGTAFSTTSDASGNFELSGMTGTTFVLDIDTSTATPGPDNASYAGFRERIELIVGVDNVVSRPFYLPRIDATSLTTIDPGKDTMVENPNLGIALEVAAGTAVDENGDPFSGQLSISEVPENLAPVALPDRFNPATLITIQPVGVRFTQPAAISFPNTDNLAPGSEVDLWSLDPETGTFQIVGTGRVNPPGDRIEQLEGGVIAADWHFNLADALGFLISSLQDQDGCNSESNASGSGTSMRSGSQRTRAPSPYSRPNLPPLGLTYSSSTADPQPVVEFPIAVPEDPLPEIVETELSVGGVSTGSSTFWIPSPADSDGNFPRGAMQFDACEYETGTYDYELTYTYHYSGGTTASTSVQGELDINNGKHQEPFAPGWDIEARKRILRTSTDDLLLQKGDGSLLKFRPSGESLETWNRPDCSDAFWTSFDNGTTVRVDQVPFPPTFLTGNVDYLDTVIKGTFEMEPSGDANFVGFVFGVQNPQTDCNDPFDLYLFDWKAVSETRNGRTAHEGFTLTRVQGTVANLEAFWDHDDPAMTVLASDYGPGHGWSMGTRHRFELEYRNDRIIIKIDGETIFDVPGAFQTGKFGFYNYNQLSARYRKQQDSVAYEGPLGNFSTLIENGDGSFTQFLANRHVLEYNNQGLLISERDRNSLMTQYNYDQADRLTQIVSPFGETITYAYDNQTGLLTSCTDPASRVTSFAYDQNRNLISITDPDQSVRQFTYDQRHRMLSETSKTGHTTRYTYNFAGQQIRSERPDGSASELVPAIARLVADPQSQAGTLEAPKRALFPDELITSVTDGNGNTTQFGLDGFGNSTTVTDPLGRSISVTRDNDGLPSLLTRPDDSQVSFEFSNLGELITLREETDGRFQQVQRDLTTNVPTSAQDWVGNLWQFNISAEGNVTSVVDPSFIGTTFFAYDDPGCPGFPTQVDNRDGGQHTYVYDSQCRLIQVTDGEMNQTQITYDAANMITSVLDANGETTSFEYDAMDRLVKVIQPNAVPANLDCGNQGVTCYDYDEAGSLISVQNAAGEQTFYTFDALNRIVAVTDPLGNSERFTYDGAGNPTSFTDGLGQVTRYHYDAANRLTSVTTFAGTANAQTVSYDYDQRDNIVLAENDDVLMTFQYNFRGEVTQVTTDFKADQVGAYTLDYTRDRNGDITQSVHSLLGTTQYQRNGLGLITQLTDPFNDSYSLSYTADGYRSRIDYPHDLVQTFNYDGNQQLVDVQMYRDDQTPTDYQISYNYDGLGNRTERQRQHPDLNTEPAQSYLYDTRSFITEAGLAPLGSTAQTWTYDDAGNLLTRNGSNPFTYNAADQLLEDDRYTYTYDDQGNLATRTESGTQQTDRYFYDGFQRLSRIESASGSAIEYRYDPLGRRISKDVDGTQTFFLYDREDVVAEVDPLAALQLQYVHGPGFDDPLRMVQNGQSYFYGFDGQANVVELKDTSGNAAALYDYDTFGNTAIQQGAIADSNPYRFTGRRYDSESGLYYYRARYLDPYSGRFTQIDPFPGISSLPITYNRYAYAWNNPINMIDPTGELPPPVIGVLVVVTGGITTGAADAFFVATTGGTGSEIRTAFVAGFAGGAVATTVGILAGNPLAGGAVGGIAGDLTKQLISNGFNLNCIDFGSLLINGASGALFSKFSVPTGVPADEMRALGQGGKGLQDLYDSLGKAPLDAWTTDSANYIRNRR
jgi:RHS repeat-associated protein